MPWINVAKVLGNLFCAKHSLIRHVLRPTAAKTCQRGECFAQSEMPRTLATLIHGTGPCQCGTQPLSVTTPTIVSDNPNRCQRRPWISCQHQVRVLGGAQGPGAANITRCWCCQQNQFHILLQTRIGHERGLRDEPYRAHPMHGKSCDPETSFGTARGPESSQDDRKSNL